MSSGDATFPSLLAAQTRESVLEYLTTTFALADPETQNALDGFLGDPRTGIFRGPYLKIRTPYQPVDEQWTSPLEWMPAGFRPFQHQAEAFARLSSNGKAPQPTIVTTGTGSGKTESFLVPLLDHAQRAKARGEHGIKAIILYPMNALVTDQARRLASYIAGEPALREVAAGVYIGGRGSRKKSTKSALVDNREVLRQNPPDILLTNYRMLDLLLLRSADTPLWAGAATSLQYLVLDEFHTYDGAQGTDVAMLLRRLGAKIGVAAEGRPIGRITPVATSATLGGGSGTEDLRAFAETVFGTPFDSRSVVGETALSAADVVPDVDFSLQIPTVTDMCAVARPESDDPQSWAALAEVVLSTDSQDQDDDVDCSDPIAIGEGLRRHFLTRAVIDGLGQQPRDVADAVSAVAEAGAFPWGVHNNTAPREVQDALLRFLALLSVARVRDSAGNARPLVTVQVQLWVREINRMVRAVTQEPEFRWWHDSAADELRYLPATYCRVCGRAGWMASTTELGDSLSCDPTAIWRASVRQKSKTRALLLASPDEDGVRHLDPMTLELSATSSDGTLPVHVSADDADAANQMCPSCGAHNSIRYMGSSVATLLSVGLTTEFGSSLLADEEKKTLVFTDSVQDAAHRAAFIESRAFTFNFRSALYNAVGDEPATLRDVAAGIAGDTPMEGLYAITPPDFTRGLALDADWLDHDHGGRLRDLLTSRLAFQVEMEAGLSSRTGRTLELTSTLAFGVDIDLDAFAARSRETHQNLPQLSMTELPAAASYRVWLVGLLDHLRTAGGILHPWLAPYIKDEGRRWSIWGASPDGMPQFPAGRPAPSFFTSGAVGRSSFQSLNPKGESWLTDWTKRCLQVSAGEARALLNDIVEQLASDDGPLERRTGERGSRIYGLTPDRVTVEKTDPARLQCPICQHVQPSTRRRLEVWEDAPCPRMRCRGRLAPVEIEGRNFYRSLYSSGRIRRIVSTEHTGLLTREDREEVEARFKAGASAADPNILACTPTLELGIDIGDLSTVALASLPRSTANYLQRVGRAGRSTGNAFVLAAVPTSPRDLYFFAEPENLLAGEVLPPGAYLDATELLQRQYFAFCLDKQAGGALEVPQPMPNLFSECFTDGMAEGKWLRSTIDVCTEHVSSLIVEFLELFGTHVTADAEESLRDFAAVGLRTTVAESVARWDQETAELHKRRNELLKAIEDIEKHGHLDEKQQEDRKRCWGEYKALSDQLNERATQRETLTGMSGVGLLPNYNLLDDATTLDVHLWWTTGDDKNGRPQTEALDLTYDRGRSVALTELAPGAFFYADGKRVEVDAVDIGPSSKPHWRETRLCPDCGWGTTEIQAVASCPRCHSTAVSDSGAVHRVLQLRKVSAVHRLDDALIDEEDDDRTRTFFGTVTGVDVRPESILRAWRLSDRAFGAEYARDTTIRTVNTGLGDAPGDEITIAGERRNAPGFLTCAHCGVVAKIASATADVRHRGFCSTRRGADEQWTRLLLAHELRTQAVRLLLPVSVLHFERKLTSFKGALLLGLRKDFGGDPQHLSVVASSMTDADGAVRRFLVLHDTVPGGTGYLDRFGEPERLRHIMELARETLVNCPCRTEEREACHRCLYGVLSSGEMSNASRELALSLLDEFLTDWDVEPIATVTGIDIGSVQLSELELRFREALKEYITKREGASFEISIGSTGEELDIRLPGPDGEVRRWRARFLVKMAENGVATEPDVLLTRVDAQTADVAVYLDGKQFHASVENNITADDAVKRDALRRADKRVWSIAWSDVAAFEDPSPKNAVADMLHLHMKNQVSESVADPRVQAMWGNPVDFLMEYLADPDADVWGAGAAATVTSLVTASGKHGRADFVRCSPSALQSTLGEMACGGTPADDPGGTVVVVPRHGLSGLPLLVCADPADMETTLGVLAVLDDRDDVVGGPEHDAQWRGWLRWSNILQFIALPTFDAIMPRRMTAVWTTKSLDMFMAQPVPLAQSVESEDESRPARPEWDLVFEFADPALTSLIETLAEQSIGIPEAGYEVGGADLAWPVELGWDESKVAVVIDHDEERERWLTDHGWTTVRFDEQSDLEAVVERISEMVKEGDA